MHKGLNIIFAFTLLFVLAGGSPGGAAPVIPWQDKVDPWILNTAAAEGEAEFLVFLSEQADLSPASRMGTKLEKGEFVFATLTAVADRTQGPVLAALEALGVPHRPYWVANMVWVRGDLDVIQAMASRLDVAHLYANPAVRLAEPVERGAGSDHDSPEAIEWNILQVNADDLWALGITGQDVVIAGQDTGYRWDHAALIDQYRGWNGTVADHNYNWHDAIHSGGGSCGADVNFPCDDHGHGTHTMGTMVGDDGGSNQIGMAPGARWIGCRNMDVGVGTPATYSECFQWFIAPTDLNNQNPDPSLAPHVINNSWGCPPSEGCIDPNALLTVVENTRAAGIFVSVSAGNSGSACSTVDDPPAIYEASFTIGATDSGDNIAGFSSRGPVTVDGSNRLKPNVSAPGVNIRSSTRNGGYQGGWSGTSMASPHVAGLVGLLISAQPSLAGQIDSLEDIIEQSAVPRTTTQTCGGVPGSNIPNNTYGWGRIDALAAYDSFASHLELDKTVSAVQIEPGGTLTYTLTVTHTQGVTLTHNVVLTDVLPADTIFLDATQPYTFDGSTVQWDQASLDVGDSWSVALVVQVDPAASGVISNADYAVRSDEVATVAGAAVDTTVVPFQIGVEKTASAAFVNPGELLTYTLRVDNLHPFAPVHNLVLTDVLPVETSFISATLPYTLQGSTVRWDAPSLAANDAWTVDLVVRVALTATGAITNADYGVLGDEFSFIGGEMVSTSVTTRGVSLTPDLSQTALPGSSVVYTHTLRNTGDITDTYDLSHQSSQAWAATYNTPISLSPGQSVPIVVSVMVPAVASDGAVDTLILTAVSQADTAVSDSVTDTTTVEEMTVNYYLYSPLIVNQP